MRDGYSLLDDKTYDTYEIRKVGDVEFSRYEKGADGRETVLTDSYRVVTALPKRLTVAEALKGRTFAMEDRGDHYAVDSNYSIPNIPCVTDDLVYAPIVSGLHEATVTYGGQNKGWPIQEDISKEVAKYSSQPKPKNWVYSTWPGYRYGYFFNDEKGTHPSWLFKANGNDVSFQKYGPTQANWPEGAYNDVPFGLHIDTSGKVYVPKQQPIEYPQRQGGAPVPTQLQLAYKNWDNDLRCVVINKTSAIISVSRTIWPGGSEAYYPAETFLPGYAVIGEEADRYWGLKGLETDKAAWWAGDDCVRGACSGQSRMPFRNGCSIDGFDFGQGDGFNWTELKDQMAANGIIIPREQMYRIQIYQQSKPEEPARMMVELSYEQDSKGRWQPKMTPGTKTDLKLTTGDNPRYIVNGHIYPGNRIFAVLLDM